MNYDPIAGVDIYTATSLTTAQANMLSNLVANYASPALVQPPSFLGTVQTPLLLGTFGSFTNVSASLLAAPGLATLSVASPASLTTLQAAQRACCHWYPTGLREKSVVTVSTSLAVGGRSGQAVRACFVACLADADITLFLETTCPWLFRTALPLRAFVSPFCVDL